MVIAGELPEPTDTIEWPDRCVALLGQLIGDGSYLVHQPLRYTTSSMENSECVAEAASLEFASAGTCTSQVGSWNMFFLSNNGIRWHPAGANAWLRRLGIFGQRSPQKRVPRDAFRLSNRQIGLLLRHLWATDGSIGNHEDHAVTIYYATNSPGLASDVSALLLRLGIVTRTATVKERPYRDGYQVHVSGATDQLRFLDLVGAFGPRELPAMLARERLSQLKPNTNADPFPPS